MSGCCFVGSSARTTTRSRRTGAGRAGDAPRSPGALSVGFEAQRRRQHADDEAVDEGHSIRVGGGRRRLLHDAPGGEKELLVRWIMIIAIVSYHRMIVARRPSPSPREASQTRLVFGRVSTILVTSFSIAVPSFSLPAPRPRIADSQLRVFVSMRPPWPVSHPTLSRAARVCTPFCVPHGAVFLYECAAGHLIARASGGWGIQAGDSALAMSSPHVAAAVREDGHTRGGMAARLLDGGEAPVARAPVSVIPSTRHEARRWVGRVGVSAVDVVLGARVGPDRLGGGSISRPPLPARPCSPLSAVSPRARLPSSETTNGGSRCDDALPYGTHSVTVLLQNIQNLHN